MQKSYQKFTKDVFIVGTTYVLTSLVGLVQLPLLTKFLGAHEYGIWAQVFVTVGLILPLTNLGISGAMLRYLPAEKDHGKIREDFYSVVSVIFLINLAASLATIIFAGPLADNFFDGAVNIVRMTGGIILLSALNGLYLNFIRTLRQMKRYCAFLIAEEYGRVGLIAYLVLNGHGIFSVIVGVLALKVLIFLALFFTVNAQFSFKRPHFLRLREFLDYGLPLVPMGIAFWFVGLSDRYVISFFLGTTAVGIYSAAYGIGSLPYSIVGVLTLALIAPLAKLYDEGRMDEVKTHLSYSLKYFLAVIIPFVFGAAVLAEPILKLFTTPEIASQGRFVLPTIALAISFLGVNSIVYQVLLLSKKTKLMALIWVTAAVLNIGLNIVAVPLLGVMGAASTTLFVYGLVLGLISYYSFRELRFNVHWPFIIKSLVASAIMSMAVWKMAPQGNLSTILTVVAGVVIYGAVLVLLRGFSKGEFSFFRGLVRQKAPLTISNDY